MLKDYEDSEITLVKSHDKENVRNSGISIFYSEQCGKVCIVCSDDFRKELFLMT